MKDRFQKLEPWLYVFSIGLALLLRFLHLGSVPLSDIEAANALHALAVAGGDTNGGTEYSLYVILTACLFYFFSSNEFLARFWPAIAGTLLVLTPLFFRRQMGTLPAAIFAIFLALDPTFISASRTASGDILSILFFLAAAGFILAHNATRAGISAGLGILSGPGIWFGLGVTLFALLFERIFRLLRRQIDDDEKPFSLMVTSPWNWKSFLLWFCGTIVFSGSLFFMIPQGWNGIFSGLTGYFKGWTQFSGISIQQTLGGIFFFETMPVALAIVALVKSLIHREKGNRYFYWAIIASVFLTLLYPGKQLTHLMWFIYPLWGFTLKNLTSSYLSLSNERVPFYGMVFLVLIAVVFAWVNFSGLFTQTFADQIQYQLRLASIAGAVILIFITGVLLTWGWDWRITLKSLLIGFTLVLVAFNIRAASNGVRSDLPQQFWRNQQFIDQSLFLETIRDYQRWKTGFENLTDTYILQADSNTLRWALRDVPDTAFVETLPYALMPAMVVTRGNQTLNLVDQYAGQDFVLSRVTDWEKMTLSDWMRWFVSSKAPTQDEPIILWVGADLFPGSETIELTP